MAADKEKRQASRSGALLRLGLMVGVVLIGGVGGYVLNRTMSTPAAAGAEEPADKPLGKDDYSYIAFEPLTVTLNTPLKNRYLRATLALAVPSKSLDGTTSLVDKRKPVLVDILVTYLSSLTLEDVGDAKRLNKIRREIMDLLNDELWPDGKPQIDNVLFKDWAVQ